MEQTNIFKDGSALARRPAVTHAAAPPEISPKDESVTADLGFLRLTSSEDYVVRRVHLSSFLVSGKCCLWCLASAPLYRRFTLKAPVNKTIKKRLCAMFHDENLGKFVLGSTKQFLKNHREERKPRRRLDNCCFRIMSQCR